MPSREPVSSPRLRALQRDLDAGNPCALERFWAEISHRGTPLMEPLADRPGHSWVTFFWRALEPMDSVIVASLLGAKGLGSKAMAPLSGTDVWWKTYLVADDLCTSYQLSPNACSEGEMSLTCGRDPLANRQPDPLNPRQFAFPSGSEQEHLNGLVLSVVQLAQAPLQPYLVRGPGVPSGWVELHRIRSAILGNERRIWVYLPHGYRPDAGPYGCAVLLDGWIYTHAMVAPITLDNLIALGKIPPLVALMVDSKDQEIRQLELACHAPFAGFVNYELMPWARQRFRLSDDPKQSLIGGATLGGLAAAYVAINWPELFGKVLSQSGLFQWRPNWDQEREWFRRKVTAMPKIDLDFYLEVGLLEGNGDPQDVTSLAANRRLREALDCLGYSLYYHEYNGGPDPICWRGSLADGLIALLGGNQSGV